MKLSLKDTSEDTSEEFLQKTFNWLTKWLLPQDKEIKNFKSLWVVYMQYIFYEEKLGFSDFIKLVFLKDLYLYYKFPENKNDFHRKYWTIEVFNDSDKVTSAILILICKGVASECNNIIT